MIAKTWSVTFFIGRRCNLFLFFVTFIKRAICPLQLCFVTLEEYSRVQIQGEENLKRVEVGGELVAVLEKRAVDAKREGYFIVQVRMGVYVGEGGNGR